MSTWASSKYRKEALEKSQKRERLALEEVGGWWHDEKQSRPTTATAKTATTCSAPLIRSTSPRRWLEQLPLLGGFFFFSLPVERREEEKKGWQLDGEAFRGLQEREREKRDRPPTQEEDGRREFFSPGKMWQRFHHVLLPWLLEPPWGEKWRLCKHCTVEEKVL